MQAAHLRILNSDENLECLDFLDDLHKELISIITSVSKLPCPPEIRHYRGNVLLQEFTIRDNKSWQILENLGKAELHISRFMSLRKKFVYDLNIAECEEQEDALTEMERFVQSLCQEGVEVKVPGAARGPAGRPLPSSRPTPQRLYARFAPQEFRLNGVYTR